MLTEAYDADDNEKFEYYWVACKVKRGSGRHER